MCTDLDMYLSFVIHIIITEFEYFETKGSIYFEYILDYYLLMFFFNSSDKKMNILDCMLMLFFKLYNYLFVKGIFVTLNYHMLSFLCW